MNIEWSLSGLVILPVLLAGGALLTGSARAAMRFCAVGTVAVAAVAAMTVWHVFKFGPVTTSGGWLAVDALSAYHIAVMMLVYSISAVYSTAYFAIRAEGGELTTLRARRYCALWFGSLAAMTLVLVSNELGLMWVGIEASTLLTAFLICTHSTPPALEAMWKYLLMCSVGVALAFTGILLIAAAAVPAGLHGADALMWTSLRDAAPKLNPMLIKAGFIFLVIGYGTKAGLAPMHNWLPDAHSQAPAPVSAVFSGFLLNAALYCILRCLPIVEAATGNTGWGRAILVVFGLVSILVAAAFIVAQRDVKRLLAYSSVEHIGVMALGVGLGGAGAVAALFHMLNHSMCKVLAFLSAGSLGKVYGTHDMTGMTGILGVSRTRGTALLLALMALIGMAPFAIFLSEFMILKAALDGRRMTVAILFLAGLCIVAVGVLRHAIAMAWRPAPGVAPKSRSGILEAGLVTAVLAVVTLLGVWPPAAFLRILARAAAILGVQS